VKEQCLAAWGSVKIGGGFHYLDCNMLARGTSLKAFSLANFSSVKELQSLLLWGSLGHVHDSLIALQAIHFMPVLNLPLPSVAGFHCSVVFLLRQSV